MGRCWRLLLGFKLLQTLGNRLRNDAVSVFVRVHVTRTFGVESLRDGSFQCLQRVHIGNPRVRHKLECLRSRQALVDEKVVDIFVERELGIVFEII